MSGCSQASRVSMASQPLCALSGTCPEGLGCLWRTSRFFSEAGSMSFSPQGSQIQRNKTQDVRGHLQVQVNVGNFE